MRQQYCVIYNMGPHDSIEEEGSKEVCELYIKACQSAYDKPLTTIPP